MQRRTWFLTLVSTMILTTFAGTIVAQPDSAKPQTNPLMNLKVSHAIDTTTGAVDSAYRFIIEVRHRVFTDFQEIDTVYLHQKFPIGEGENIGEVFVFNPHLIITDKGEYLKISDTLYNPAIRVRVIQKDSIIQQSWAFFFSDAPHFRRNDILGFKLVSFDVPAKFIKADGPQDLDEPAPDSSSGKAK